jgi:hypothetical protein
MCKKTFLSAVIIAMVIGLGLVGHAEHAQIDFDKGIDISPFVKSITKKVATNDAAAPRISTSQSSSWALHPILDAASAVDPRDVVKRKPFGEVGPSHNRLFNYLSNHKNHIYMRNLLVDPRMDNVNLELREALRAEGTSLTKERDGMLPEARRLDATDTALAKEKENIDQSKRDLDVRLAEIKRQGAEHDRLCLPTHPPERHQWCVDNARRLNAIIDIYNEDVREHNAWVADWRRRVDELTPAWDTFVNRIREWEAALKKLIDKIERVINKPDRYELCTLTLAEGGVCLYACPSGAGHAIDYPVPGEPSSCPGTILVEIVPPPALMNRKQ